MKAGRAWLVAAAIAATGAAACNGDAFLGPPAGRDNAALFDQMWTALDRHYSFFEMKGIDWADARTRYRPLAVDAADDGALADVMGQMLAELHDVHVSLTPSGAGSTIRYLSRFETLATLASHRDVFDRYVPGADTTAGGHIRFGFAAPGVGYIAIQDFRGSGWAQEVDEALRKLDGMHGLIIDVRNNRGGSIQVAVSIAGRFADKERTYGYVRLRNGPAHSDFTDYIPERVGPTGRRFLGNVYVLTNRQTMSSAEDFVLAMRTFEHVTIVGDTTIGASGSPVVRELANGWTYQFSEWIEYTPEREHFEGIGLAPDVAVPATVSQASRGIDAAFEAALKHAVARNGT